MVEKKVAGAEISIAAEPDEEPTKVVDLMEALKASVEAAKKAKESAPKKKPAPKSKASAS
jgi:DNA end-binding protein Ku